MALLKNMHVINHLITVIITVQVWQATMIAVTTNPENWKEKRERERYQKYAFCSTSWLLEKPIFSWTKLKGSKFSFVREFIKKIIEIYKITRQIWQSQTFPFRNILIRRIQGRLVIRVANSLKTNFMWAIQRQREREGEKWREGEGESGGSQVRMAIGLRPVPHHRQQRQLLQRPHRYQSYKSTTFVVVHLSAHAFPAI